MEKVKIEFNNDMTFIAEHTADGKIKPYIVMGTGKDISDEIVTEFESMDEQDFIDIFTKPDDSNVSCVGINKVIYEDDKVKISSTGRDYDFIACVENKTDKEIWLIFPEETGVENFSVSPNNWVGLLADEDGRFTFDEIKERNFAVKTNCPEE